MNLRTTIYCIKQGIINIKRNKLFSLASVGTIAACIFLIGLFFAMVMNFQYIVKNAEEQVGITVFFDEGTTQERMDAIGEQIKGMDGVLNIEFTSAEKAWEEFQKSYFADSPELAEGFKEDNPLANSANYAVYIEDISKQSEYVKEIEQIENVRLVKYSESAVSTMTNFGRFVGYASIAIILVLLGVGIFLISNTVMMGISVRNKEIKIMKLIGATNTFVRAPFIIEGMVIGIIGAAIPLVLLFVLYDRVVDFVMSQFHALSSIVSFLPIHSVFVFLVPISFGVGAGIGLLGSVASIRKHLKI
ncbi:MAG: ABC transporter permease [Lachnospiraceae bacterium]|nr:ABC transporter permease [Lachnospiraceae bacterium]